MKENGEENPLESRAIEFCRHLMSMGLTPGKLFLDRIELDAGKELTRES